MTIGRASWLDELKSRINLEFVARQYTTLRPMGGSLRGPCPIHGGTNPNFALSPGKPTYHCFKCDWSGDAFALIQELEGCDFKAAARHLAQLFSVEITPRRPLRRHEVAAHEARHPPTVALEAAISVATLEPLLGPLWSDPACRWDPATRRVFYVVADRDGEPLAWHTYAPLNSVDHEPVRGLLDIPHDVLFNANVTSEDLRHRVCGRIRAKGRHEAECWLVDTPLTAAACLAAGWPTAIASPAGRAAWSLRENGAESPLNDPQLRLIQQHGVGRLVVAVPMQGRHRAHQAVGHALEVAAARFGISVTFIVPDSLHTSARKDSTAGWLLDYQDPSVALQAWGGRQRNAFERRVTQVVEAFRSGAIAMETAVGKIRPTLEAAESGPDPSLALAYKIWAIRAMGGVRDQSHWVSALSGRTPANAVAEDF